MTEPLLSVRDLRTHIRTDAGTVRAVDGVSFDVHRGETVCLVGQSGCGKSVTCASLTGLLPRGRAEIVGGSVALSGTDLVELDESALRSIRGGRIGYVFQQPQRVLDPVYTVGEQIVEAIRLHRDVDAKSARDRAIELLRRVGIPRPRERVDDYPHQFSGGMCQRVAIAIALAPEPDLIVADEPTTSVDVTVQAHLLELLRSLQDEEELAILLVTHDLRVVAAIADSVVVMYGGTVVERGPVEALFERPAHPYTQALFSSFRPIDGVAVESEQIEVPTNGCRFRRECPHAIEACAVDAQPAFEAVGGSSVHRASCVYYGPDHDPTPLLEGSQRVQPDVMEVDDD